ncbi:MerC domain-containing protein [Maribacter sp. IgM3_T14_3]|uniref:MerC domain-containing protein n=1 Tax=Maribacter sp. IgM3_T14_3 TaxID=3415140 RepID=UPI003C702E55
MKQIKTNHQTFDIIAVTSAILCALHCVALPILLSFSAFAGLYVLQNPIIEWFFIAFGLLLILVSLWPSFRKIHNSKIPLWFAGFGFVFIVASRINFSYWWEAGNTALGACLIAYAHYRNWRLLKNSNHEH